MNARIREALEALEAALERLRFAFSAPESALFQLRLVCEEENLEETLVETLEDTRDERENLKRRCAELEKLYNERTLEAHGLLLGNQRLVAELNATLGVKKREGL